LESFELYGKIGEFLATLGKFTSRVTTSLDELFTIIDGNIMDPDADGKGNLMSVPD
jgi:hypothetical protein